MKYVSVVSVQETNLDSVWDTQVSANKRHVQDSCGDSKHTTKVNVTILPY